MPVKKHSSLQTFFLKPLIPTICFSKHIYGNRFFLKKRRGGFYLWIFKSLCSFKAIGLSGTMTLHHALWVFQNRQNLKPFRASSFLKRIVRRSFNRRFQDTVSPAYAGIKIFDSLSIRVICNAFHSKTWLPQFHLK